MKEKKVIRYECEHCKKKMYRKYSMELHEKVCFKNPANARACFGCKHLENATIGLYGCDNYGDRVVIRELNGYYCSKKDKNIYSPKAEILLLENYPETFKNQIPMPKECEQFEKISFDTTSIFD